MRTPTRRQQSTTAVRRPRRLAPRGGAGLCAGLAASVLLVTACGAPAADLDDDLATASAGETTLGYTGGVQQYPVPAGVTSVTITASGGSGGASNTLNNVAHAAAAEVTGTLAVQPGQLLLVSVGQEGAPASNTADDDPKGGWGGLGATGGNGNAAADTLRTGAAGGGATTVQVAAADGSDPVTVLVAGGGGGQGGVSGDPDSIGEGGTAGCSGGQHTPSWQGADGGNGSLVKGGKGGAAGGEPGTAGGRGFGGSGLGGNGGGGGGGVNGGAPGTGASGTSAAGGGGAGTSVATGMTDTDVACRLDTSGDGVKGDGQVVLTPLAG